MTTLQQKMREAVRWVDGKRRDPFGDFRADAAYAVVEPLLDDMRVAMRYVCSDVIPERSEEAAIARVKEALRG